MSVAPGIPPEHLLEHVSEHELRWLLAVREATGHDSPVEPANEADRLAHLLLRVRSDRFHLSSVPRGAATSRRGPPPRAIPFVLRCRLQAGSREFAPFRVDRLPHLNSVLLVGPRLTE
jgi:hypothetical protein